MHDVQIGDERVASALPSDYVIELPVDGFGTGQSQPRNAPMHGNLERGSASINSESLSGEGINSGVITTLEQVRERLQADDKGKWDVVLPRAQVLMHDGRIFFSDHEAYECPNGLQLSKWAMGQICQRLNIPTGYFRRCTPFLQDTQFNHWNAQASLLQSQSRAARSVAGAWAEDDNALTDHRHQHPNGVPNNGVPNNGVPNNGVVHKGVVHKGVLPNRVRENGAPQSEPEEYSLGWSQGGANGHKFQGSFYTGSEKAEYWLLRAKGDTLRAVLTDKYTPLDNRTLLDALAKSLPAHLQVQWLALEADAFHLRLIDPALSRELFPGDPVMAGIHISNSETGRRSVTVDSLAYRQVCSNGLIRLVKNKSILTQRHVAVSPYHFGALLAQALSTALSVATAFSEQMAWSTTSPLPDVEKELEQLVKEWHLSQGFVDGVKVSLGQERSDQQETVFGLLNALTRSAQSLDAESRYDMEVLAGKWLAHKSARAFHSSNAVSRSFSMTPRREAVTALAPSTFVTDTAIEKFDATVVGRSGSSANPTLQGDGAVGAQEEAESPVATTGSEDDSASGEVMAA